MTFRFRLQRVLELREQAEQARAREMAAATDVAEQARREADALAALREAQREAIDAAANGATVGELQHLTYVVRELDERLDVATEDVRTADAQLAAAQAALRDAARDRRVLDRLREKHVERHQEAALQQDRVTMDEIALAQFARRATTPPAASTAHPNAP
jgi:flagellar FliJ protein